MVNLITTNRNIYELISSIGGESS